MAILPFVAPRSLNLPGKAFEIRPSLAHRRYVLLPYRGFVMRPAGSTGPQVERQAVLLVNVFLAPSDDIRSRV